MKVFSWKVSKHKKRNTLITNCIIFAMLLMVTAFSFAGGSLSAFNASNSSTSAIYKGNPEQTNVSLMFNVYWGDEFIQPILDVLKENNAKCTFFVGGVWASKNADYLNLIVENGHELANHGYLHKDQNKLGQNENFKEISQTHQIVKSLTGIEMNLFAPPSGAYSEISLQVAEELGYKTIMWTKDTIDWRDKDSNLIYSRATKNMANGDLVLMHPTEKTLQALPDIIKTYQVAGFNVTTVTNTIS